MGRAPRLPDGNPDGRIMTLTKCPRGRTICLGYQGRGRCPPSRKLCCLRPLSLFRRWRRGRLPPAPPDRCPMRRSPTIIAQVSCGSCNRAASADIKRVSTCFPALWKHLPKAAPRPPGSMRCWVSISGSSPVCRSRRRAMSGATFERFGVILPRTAGNRSARNGRLAAVGAISIFLRVPSRAVGDHRGAGRRRGREPANTLHACSNATYRDRR